MKHFKMKLVEVDGAIEEELAEVRFSIDQTFFRYGSDGLAEKIIEDQAQQFYRILERKFREKEDEEK